MERSLTLVITLEIEEFGPQMWDPFADWVATNHPEDVAVMYEDETQSLERVTEESIRLWEQQRPQLRPTRARDRGSVVTLSPESGSVGLDGAALHFPACDRRSILDAT